MRIGSSSRFHLANAAVWTVYCGVSVAMGRAFAGGTTSGFVLIAAALSVLLWLASTGLRRIATARGWFALEAGPLAARLALAVAGLAALVQVGVALALVPSLDAGWVDLPPNSTPYTPGAAIGYWINTVIVLAMWTGAWAGWRLLRRARESELATLRAESARNALELDALRARLNPHFVFNALNNLRALILEDPARARELVTRLSSTLRHALEHSQREWTTLGEELAVAGDYLAVEQVHYEERLRPCFDVPGDLHAMRLPPMTLQLLVENAIKHGIARTAGGGELSVQATGEGGRLVLRVANPGRIVRDGDGTRVGLTFLAHRLERIGGRFSLDEHGDRVVATVEIPQ